MSISISACDQLTRLRARIQQHAILAEKIHRAEGGRVYAADLWVSAGVRRSMQVIEGFAVMVETRNISCAVSLLRLEIDTAVRLHAMTLVDDADAFYRHLSDGGRLDQFKDRSGQKMTDRHLVNSLADSTPE